MSSSLPEGFGARAAVPADIEAAAAIMYAEEEQLRGESDFAPGDLSDFWRMVDFDRSAWVVERDRTLVAFGLGIPRPARFDWWIAVHPDVTGRGLSTWLLRQSEQRVREAGISSSHVGALAENTRALRLFEHLGYRETRHYFEMRIDLDHEPEPPDWPDGIEPDRFRPEEARAFHAAIDEAFAQEWGYTALSFEEWKRHRLEAPDVDLSLWFLARDGDEIAAFARCETGRAGGGWVGIIGVRERWRRRGIGLALLREAFREFHRRGVPRVGLGVDAENPTGATRLYERAGMRVIKEDIVYEKELA